MRGLKFTHPHKRICSRIRLLCLIRKNPTAFNRGFWDDFCFSFISQARALQAGGLAAAAQAGTPSRSLARTPSSWFAASSLAKSSPSGDQPAVGGVGGCCVQDEGRLPLKFEARILEMAPQRQSPGSAQLPWFPWGVKFSHCEMLAGSGLKREY